AHSAKDRLLLVARLRDRGRARPGRAWLGRVHVARSTVRVSRRVGPLAIRRRLLSGARAGDQRLLRRRSAGVDADRVRADMRAYEEIVVARAFSASATATADPPKPWRRRAARVGGPERAALQGCDFVALGL